MFISEDNPHFTSRICREELCPSTHSKMVSYPSLRSIGTGNQISVIGSPTIYIHAPSPIVPGARGVLRISNQIICGLKNML